MATKKNFIILAIIFVIIAGFGGWYIYNDLKNPPSNGEENNQPAVSGVDIDFGTSPLPLNEEEIKKQMPDLDREIIVKVDLSEETKNRAMSEIKKIADTLKADYDKREEWLNLGIWRKTIGDYEGARQAWEFVALIRPNDAVPYNNLGDLYSQYIIDFSRAEKYYLMAIAKDPKTSFYYMKLHEFYRYFVKNPDLAESILLKGITATNDPALKNILEDYRQDIGK